MCEEKVSLEIFPHNKSNHSSGWRWSRSSGPTSTRSTGSPSTGSTANHSDFASRFVVIIVVIAKHFFVTNRIKFVAWNCFRKRKSIRSTSTRVRICEIRLTVWSGSPWIYKSDLIVPYCQEKGWLLYWLLPQIKSNWILIALKTFSLELGLL